MQEINVEVIKKNNCKISTENIQQLCEAFFCTKKITPGSTLTDFPKLLADEIECIIVEDRKLEEPHIPENHKIRWHIYALNGFVPQPELCDEDSETILYTHTVLPSAELHGIWESLTYETDIKENLLKYAATMMKFSEKGVSPKLIYSNRVILLHGPAGTGKTSLCKALAHKLSIRLSAKYSCSQLIEINSHNLFSKWFSESGKLVTKLFTYIYNALEDENILLCVLVDEIETLAMARTSSMSGNDPSDSIRVVNALLTQLDKIRKYPNVLLLTTSNMSTGLDLALVDRADVTYYVGLPTKLSIYEIYLSCINELMRVGIIQPECQLMSAAQLKSSESLESLNCEYSKKLLEISVSSYGLSGRILRKIPVTAHSYFTTTEQPSTSLPNFLQAMKSAVEFHKKQTDYFKISI